MRAIEAEPGELVVLLNSLWITLWTNLGHLLQHSDQLWLVFGRGALSQQVFHVFECVARLYLLV